MSSKNILEEVSKTNIKLLLNEPFYGHFFSSILKEESEETDSIATSFVHNQMVKLMVNKDFWSENINDSDKRYGAIKHQILHIIFKHMLKIQDFGNRQLYGIAADIAANQYILPAQLQEDAVTMEMFPELKLDREKDIAYYYKKLSEELNKVPPLQGGDAAPDEAQGGGAPSDTNPEEKPPPPPVQKLTTSQQKLKDLMEQENLHLKQHDFWDGFQQLSKSEQKIMDGFINDAIQNSVKRLRNKWHGQLPGGLKDYIKNLMQSLEPQVNWKRILRIFAESSSRTYLKNTIRRPSKRYGTTPGIKIKKKQKLLIAIDTSGSINKDELKEFFSEIYHIWKQGSEVFVVECDVVIHNKYFYKGTPPEHISGRGGTDFNAPLKFANEEYLPDAIIYFTDGFAAVPEVNSRKPILWLVSKDGLKEEEGIWKELPGRKLKMT